MMLKWNMHINKSIKFIVVGGLNTLLSMILFYMNNSIFSDSLHYLIIMLITHFMLVSVSYINFRVFVFEANTSFLEGFINANILYTITLSINAIMLWFFVDVMHTAVLPTQIVLVAAIAIFSFFSHKKFTFKDQS